MQQIVSITKQEFAELNLRRKQIKEIKQILDELGVPEFVAPRAFRGRLDQGKDNWTIDLLDNHTFSRTQQVRVKVDKCEETFSFNENKFKEKLNRLISICDKANQDRIQKESSLNRIPADLRHYVSYDPDTRKYKAKITLVSISSNEQNIIDFLTKIKQIKTQYDSSAY